MKLASYLIKEIKTQIEKIYKKKSNEELVVFREGFAFALPGQIRTSNLHVTTYIHLNEGKRQQISTHLVMNSA